ncbi:MAG: DNA recombination protein RmuC [Thermoanaerobaculia bacterium]
MPDLWWLIPVALVLGAVLAWLVQAVRLAAVRKEAELLRLDLADTEEERERTQASAQDIDERRELAERELAAAREQLRGGEQRLVEQKGLLETAEERLKDAFRSVGAQSLESNTRQFLDLAKRTFEGLLESTRSENQHRHEAIQGLLDPVRQTLDKLEQRTGEIEKARQDAYSRIDQQIHALAEQATGIQERAASLEGALRGSQTRGRWGELALRNVVELAGLSEHVDFEEQETTAEGGRPDMLVNLPHGRRIAVDAKAPLTAYLEAIEATDPKAREGAMKRHAAAVRGHVQTLARRDYAAAVDGNVDLVVLFLPGEPIYAAAFEHAPGLQEEALRARVLITTPTTLVALLRTVGIYWQQQALAENALQIAGVGQELYKRLGVFSNNLAGVGSGLESAMKSYNKAVGSLERSVLPSARRLKELRATTADDIESPKLAETSRREIGSAELRSLAGDEE